MSYPSILVYDDTAFRLQYPFFANVTTYPEITLQTNFTNGTSYISDYNAGILQGQSRQTALYLMTAHITALNDIIVANNGAAPGYVTNAKIDKISVTLEPPPAKNQFQWWLNLTPWGQQLLALLQVQSAGGWAVGGNPERLGMRRVGGGFGGLRSRFFRG